MVQCWVNIVRADRVHAELLHKRSIAQAVGRVGQRIGRVGGSVCSLSTWLIIYSDDDEAILGFLFGAMLVQSLGVVFYFFFFFFFLSKKLACVGGYNREKEWECIHRINKVLSPNFYCVNSID